MSTISVELEQTLSGLDAKSASLLERLVRDALALVRENRANPERTDAKGWPLGYFEKTAGSFAGEPLEAPEDPPPTPTPDW